MTCYVVLTRLRTEKGWSALWFDSENQAWDHWHETVSKTVECRVIEVPVVRGGFEFVERPL